MEKFIIAVEGLTGATKTTTIYNMLVPFFKQKGYSVMVVDEPVNLWTDILSLFYNAPALYGYQFQTTVLCDRLINTINMFKEYPDTHIFILDRSIFTDKVFMQTLYEQGKQTELEWKNYQKLWSLLKQLMPFEINLILYLDLPIDDTFERIKMRKREGEEHINKDYLCLLKKNHDLIIHNSQLHVLTVDNHEQLCYKIYNYLNNIIINKNVI
ncbi:MAG TPA: deoxynucleoside kinase [Candidatus Saccharimonadales bacterium]|nr:deoxynucleoside kinase [Candidatus Saccharimonadales bacterium]